MYQRQPMQQRQPGVPAPSKEQLAQMIKDSDRQYSEMLQRHKGLEKQMTELAPFQPGDEVLIKLRSCGCSKIATVERVYWNTLRQEFSYVFKTSDGEEISCNDVYDVTLIEEKQDGE